jgi:hypothetical protein
MKKILRLVTTSVLTLTLVACGEASSSVASSTTSSSVSSPVTSTFAAVTRIDLSAATDSLTQVLGAQKAVVVTATLSANANPATAVEWFVDGAKSNQTGRVFEFTPAKAGKFVISARVGSVNSTNTYTVNVGAPAFKVESAKFTDNKTIEIKAPAGASVAVTGNELLAESRYDIVKGTYFLNLKTALKQGDSATVTFTTESGTVTQVVTFDTRELNIASVSGTGVKDNKDGTYDITRPHIINPVGELLNTTVNPITVTFDADNMKANQVAFTIDRISAPVGADAFLNQIGLTNILLDKDSTAGQFVIPVSRTTPLGAYVFEKKLGTLTKRVTLNVVAPEAAIKFADIKNATDGFDLGVFKGEISSKLFIFEDEASIGTTSKRSTKTFNLVYKPAGFAGLVGVPANADGSFDIVKEYLPIANAFKEFYFDLNGEFFSVPTNALEQASISPNQVQLSVLAPDGLPQMRAQLATQVALPTLGSGFRDKFNLPAVVQRVDNSTVVGKYTYTLRVLQAGVEIFKKEVVINVKDFEQKSTLTASVGDASTMFASIFTTFKNELAIPALDAADGYMITSSISASPSVAENYSLIKEKLEGNFVTKTGFAVLTPFNFTTYTAARTKFVTDFLAALPFRNGVAFSAQDESANNTALRNKFLQFFSPYTSTISANALVITDGNSEAIFASATGAKAVLIVTGLTDAMITKLSATPTTTTTQELYNTAKATYEKKVADLFPTYEDYLAVITRNSTTELKPNASGVYIVEKPAVQGLDTKTLTFDLELQKFESKTNAAATVANSFVNNVRKELIPLVKNVSGPGLLPNSAFNTANTKIAIQLNESGTSESVATVDTLEVPTASTYVSYVAPTFGSSAERPVASQQVTIENIFAIDVEFLTPNGDYTFNLNIGNIVKTITVRVVNPVPVVDFKLVPTATDGISGNLFTYDAVADVYNFTLGAKPSSADADKARFKLSLETSNIIPASGKMAYTFIKSTPDNSTTESNLANVTVVGGNDGKYSLTTADGGIVGLRLGIEIQFTTKGTYVYDLTLGGTRKVITIVVAEYPNLSDVELLVGTSKVNTFDSRFLLADTVKAFSINAKGVNLPSSDVFYSLTIGDTVDANIRSSQTDLVRATAGTFDSGNIRPLDLTKGIPVQLVAETDKPSDFNLANNSTLVNRVKFIQVTLYRRTNKVTGFDPLSPLSDLTVIGHETITIWMGPLPLYPTVTAVTSVAGATKTIDLSITSSVAGTLYWVLVAADATAPTFSQLLAGTAIASLVANTASNSTITAAAASTAYDFWFVVIATDGSLFSAPRAIRVTSKA